METTSSDKGILCKGIEVEEPVTEQRVWLAVLLQAVEDWRSENVKLHREADQFLFREKNDFDVVCTGRKSNRAVSGATSCGLHSGAMERS